MILVGFLGSYSLGGLSCSCEVWSERKGGGEEEVWIFGVEHKLNFGGNFFEFGGRIELSEVFGIGYGLYSLGLTSLYLEVE